MRWAVAWMLFVSVMVVGSSGSAQVIVAHRGASYDAPENTLAAFRLAWQQGADGIEGDFYLTRDKQIVCIHDADTARTGGSRRIVAESTLAELRTLEYGGWKGERFHGEPLPTFAEVLATVPPGKLFVVELKVGPEIIAPLQAELERANARETNLLIISFHEATVRESKRLLPGIRAHWLTGYKQDKASGRWSPSLAEVARGLRESRADGLGTQANRTIVTPDFLEQLRQGGLKEFHVWTVDDPDDARYFRSQGAIGITTNRPGFLKTSLGSSFSR